MRVGLAFKRSDALQLLQAASISFPNFKRAQLTVLPPKACSCRGCLCHDLKQPRQLHLLSWVLPWAQSAGSSKCLDELKVPEVPTTLSVLEFVSQVPTFISGRHFGDRQTKAYREIIGGIWQTLRLTLPCTDNTKALWDLQTLPWSHRLYPLLNSNKLWLRTPLLIEQWWIHSYNSCQTHTHTHTHTHTNTHTHTRWASPYQSYFRPSNLQLPVPWASGTSPAVSLARPKGESVFETHLDTHRFRSLR
jgi:hypothetical protein